MNIGYRQELLRKLIHLSSLWIPLSVYYIDLNHSRLLIYVATVLMVVADLLRNKSKFVALIVERFFLPIMRQREKESSILTGASYMMISASLCITILSPISTILSISVLVVSDTAAALVGKAIGKTKIYDKSLEGLVAFLLTSYMIVLLLYWTYNLQLSWCISAFIACSIGGIVELLSAVLRIDDNLTIPISVGVTLESICKLTSFYISL